MNKRREIEEKRGKGKEEKGFADEDKKGFADEDKKEFGRKRDVNTLRRLAKKNIY